ncbi:MAG: hypothetical protein KUG73_05525 [Pseudomonadales bacterium]|nr:hypothetical protein [Pseudomonadales bacterium]
MKKSCFSYRLSFYFLYLVTFSLISSVSYADGSTIDKVYVPYVQALEKEIEYRVLVEDEGSEASGSEGSHSRSMHKLGYGQSFAENWFAEIYVIGEQSAGEAFSASEYELEAILQLTEQGEFALDWGVLFELERSAQDDVWEANVGLLGVKDFENISVVGNAFVGREWGSDIESEFEVAGSLQVRYRLRPEFEPGIEWYSSQDTHAIGPVASGRVSVAPRQKLFWQLGLIFGIASNTANKTLQFQIEYEFL